MAIDLNSIVKPTGKVKPPLILIHGVAGIGKTTFATNAPRPIIIPVEDGLGGIQCESFPKPSKYQDVVDAMVSLLSGEHNYKTLILDSTSALEPLIWKDVVAEENKDKAKKKKDGYESIEDIGYAKGYIFSLPYWERLVSLAQQLRDERKMCVIFIAHTLVKRFDNPEGDPYDRYQIALHEKAADLIKRQFDVVGFANYEVSIVKKDSADTKGKAIGTGERTLYLQESPAKIAKARDGYAKEVEIPFTWKAFQDNIGHKPVETTQETK
jgi:hypothetical protein